MSLLEKALRGTKATQGQGGLFAKASVAKAQAASLSPSAPVLPADEGIAEEPPFVPPRFPLSVSELGALESELLSLRDSPDYLLSVFARITEAVPIEALALFLPQGEGFGLAASLGFPAATMEYVPLSIARGSGRPGDGLPGEAAAVISSLLGVSPTLRLRGATMLGPEGGVVGQWVFADGVLEYADRETIEAVGQLLAAPGKRPGGASGLMYPSSNPSRELAAEAQGQAYAIAMSLDLRNTYIELELRIPGILPSAFFAMLAAAARRVLGHNGAVLHTDEGLLHCLFFSSSTLDPDLGLFQFRKSLKRALSILEGIELSGGRSQLIDVAGGGTEASLRRFLAE